ncbi:PHP domain-containing protein [Candidatus Parcubacteria bacterium]|nr:PHP domain-containing protein [Candidatus Parcubacteria bacterium]
MKYLTKRIIWGRLFENLSSFHGSTFIDGHVHSNYSPDSTVRPLEIIKRAKEIGLNGVAIADHNEIQGNLEATENNLDIMVIPAIEVTAGENVKQEQLGAHILCYFNEPRLLKKFYDNVILPNKGHRAFGRLKLTIEDIIKNTKKYGGIAIAPHPFVMAFTGIGHWLYPDIIQDIDAVEVINSYTAKSANMKAIEFSELNNKPITAGSDAHKLKEIGGAVMISQKVNSVAEFINEIKEKRIKILGKSMNSIVKIPLFWQREFLNIKISFSQKCLFEHFWYGYVINAPYYYLNKIRKKDKFILPKV